MGIDLAYPSLTMLSGAIYYINRGQGVRGRVDAVPLTPFSCQKNTEVFTPPGFVSRSLVVYKQASVRRSKDLSNLCSKNASRPLTKQCTDRRNQWYSWCQSRRAWASFGNCCRFWKTFRTAVLSFWISLDQLLKASTRAPMVKALSHLDLMIVSL